MERMHFYPLHLYMRFDFLLLSFPRVYFKVNLEKKLNILQHEPYTEGGG